MTGVFSNFSPVVGAAIMTNTPFIKVSGCRKKTTSFFVLHVLWLLVQINIFTICETFCSFLLSGQYDVMCNRDNSDQSGMKDCFEMTGQNNILPGKKSEVCYCIFHFIVFSIFCSLDKEFRIQKKFVTSTHTKCMRGVIEI